MDETLGLERMDVGEDGREGDGGFLEGFFLGCAATTHADVGLMREVLPRIGWRRFHCNNPILVKARFISCSFSANAGRVAPTKVRCALIHIAGAQLRLGDVASPGFLRKTKRHLLRVELLAAAAPVRGYQAGPPNWTCAKTVFSMLRLSSNSGLWRLP